MTSHIRRIAAAVGALLLAPATALTAQAETSSTATSTMPTTRAAAPITARVDVDGDHRRDTVRLARRSANADDITFRLSVHTAARTRAHVDITVPNYVDSLAPEDVWVGTAYLDGARGSEIMLDRGGAVGDFPFVHAWTWRSGRLVPAPAPGATTRNPAWSIANHPTLVQGYTVSTRRGVRTIVAHDLRHLRGSWEKPVYRATHTTYRWTSTGWSRAGTRSGGIVDHVAATKYAGFNGLTWTN